ncbi:MAG: hypothetical protein NTY37_00760 [Methanothrix sp.]|nr:hypothetical protein [Methanothrix sp.]
MVRAKTLLADLRRNDPEVPAGVLESLERLAEKAEDAMRMQFLLGLKGEQPRSTSAILDACSRALVDSHFRVEE